MTKKYLDLEAYFLVGKRCSETVYDENLFRKIELSVDKSLHEKKMKNKFLSEIKSIYLHFLPTGFGLALSSFCFGFWFGIANPDANFLPTIYQESELIEQNTFEYFETHSFIIDEILYLKE